MSYTATQRSISHGRKKINPVATQTKLISEFSLYLYLIYKLHTVFVTDSSGKFR